MNDDEKAIIAQELVALREQQEDFWREYKEREGEGALDEIRRVLAMQQAAIDNLRVRVGRLEAMLGSSVTLTAVPEWETGSDAP